MTERGWSTHNPLRIQILRDARLELNRRTLQRVNDYIKKSIETNVKAKKLN